MLGEARPDLLLSVLVCTGRRPAPNDDKGRR